jgi:CheY-like chemotaxis protein
MGASPKSNLTLAQRATGFAPRLLVVDPDQKTWELRARLLIAGGYVIHRIGTLADAPPRWPPHLYDLVVIATEDPASRNLVEFCHKLQQNRPPVRVALLAGGSAGGANPAGAPLIPADQSAAEIAESIARLLR